MWGGLPVVLVAVVTAAVMSVWIAWRHWFPDRTRPTRWAFVTIPAIAFICCAAAGINFTEPSTVRTGVVIDRESADYHYNYGQSRASNVSILSSVFDVGSGAADADIDEDCAIVLLVLLAKALILGAFLVPHFWVLATLLMNVVMLIFTYREWTIVAPDAEM